MKVLTITGDKNFKPGNERYDIQRGAVEGFDAVYWGRGAMRPTLPAGPFNVVTVQDPFLRGVYAWHVAKRLHARFNVQVHADLDGQAWWRRLVARFVLRRADTIRVVSQKIKTQVEHMGGHKVSVLPVFIDVEMFRAIPSKEIRDLHDEGEDVLVAEKVILVVARLEKEKNIKGALDVFKEVLKQVPNAGLYILGDGSQLQELKDYAIEIGIKNKVSFAGKRYLYGFYKSADVVLITSFFESFGAVIVEALASGVPVVAPDVGVAKEAGAIVVPRHMLAEAVVRVLTQGGQGELKLALLGKAEWAAAWRKSL